ncbi:group II intron reverse transcriptase/maturase [Aneurinibacillus migulanus]|uniref:Group II intron reverse transcriptase/maturase n=1 Tax=Aneurinibacillus migulanus TaxID=47500 RepID=A0A0D1WBB5_ANEMI|nr:group II intron reverse transcriptase/maturase [Aneurinibacillus migulanus]KIV55850.1 transposase [Aneurinibacillus migulanus]KON97752.1 transposase [Aneurinibacillus migulanus]MED0894326.1 group II intron reverse transcriptase/maturase [Aneurinibacillus migulanus]MED1618982.1 group II intron reverse transcriptase/maturase [Aneurinibacillus migulanus]SDK47724.1 group II intron reverse transcriptase/maturase [Aneurinibacillus migulanus]
MTKTPIHLQELRRRIYQRTKSEPTHRFWGLFTHITKMTTLHEAYQHAKKNGGAPGIDGQSFADVEREGVIPFLENIQAELQAGTYQPQANRKVNIPKANGKMRTLQIPSIRDRVVQGALKLILEAIFEADFCPNSYGFRPKRSPHQALAEVRRSVLRRMTTVIDVDLSRYFDMIRHSILLEKIAKRVQDPQVMHLVKQIIKATGKIGVPQGGPFSPLAANIYLNEVDWTFDAIRRKTAEGNYEAVNYHRFADDMVITVSGHSSKRGWAELALQRLREQLEPLGVELNLEKTRMVNVLKGESFSFLGFDLRRVPNRSRTGTFILMTPKKKARIAVKARIRELIQNGGAKPAKDLVKQINAVLAGWVNYFRVGNASRAFSEVRDYTEMKIRTLLTRRKRIRKRSIGWRRWSNKYLYNVLGLYWDWKVYPLKSVERYR